MKKLVLAFAIAATMAACNGKNTSIENEGAVKEGGVVEDTDIPPPGSQMLGGDSIQKDTTKNRIDTLKRNP